MFEDIFFNFYEKHKEGRQYRSTFEIGGKLFTCEQRHHRYAIVPMIEGFEGGN